MMPLEQRTESGPHTVYYYTCDRDGCNHEVNRDDFENHERWIHLENATFGGHDDRRYVGVFHNWTCARRYIRDNLES